MRNDANIETALKTFTKNKSKYEIYRNYYDGKQTVAFDTDKFRDAVSEAFKTFAENYKLNLCPAVCDAVSDKLIVQSFRVDTGDEATAKAAWEMWQNNLMDIRSDEVHDEAVAIGDAYIQVWVDADGKVTIYPN